MTGIYGRQSLDKKDSISIETQVSLCKKELVQCENYRVYTDKGFSGKNTNRPEFQHLMEDVEQGLIERIIIYRLDRISRSITDFAGIMDVLERHTVSFTSVSEKFDTSTPMGRAMLFIIMVFAQLERETIAERIRDNYYSRGKNGVWLGGPAPFGFETSKTVLDGKHVSTLKPTDKLCIVEKLFADYSETGMSLGNIAREMRTSYGDSMGVWNNIKLARILHNPIYVKADADIYQYYRELGCILINEIEAYDGRRSLILYGKRDRGANKYRNLTEHVAALSLIPGVIDSSTFLKCQQKLEANRQIKNTGKGKHTWMTGLMKCAECGHSLVIKTYKDTKYLYCSGRQNNLCSVEPETLLLEEFEPVADQFVYEFLHTVDRDENTAFSVREDFACSQLKIQIHKLNEQIETLLARLMDAEDVTMDYINKKIAELDSQKQTLLNQLSANTLVHSQMDIPAPDAWISASFDQKRELAHQLIDKIYIRKNTLEILWKY